MCFIFVIFLVLTSTFKRGQNTSNLNGISCSRWWLIIVIIIDCLGIAVLIHQSPKTTQIVGYHNMSRKTSFTYQQNGTPGTIFYQVLTSQVIYYRLPFSFLILLNLLSASSLPFLMLLWAPERLLLKIFAFILILMHLCFSLTVSSGKCSVASSLCWFWCFCGFWTILSEIQNKWFSAILDKS